MDTRTSEINKQFYNKISCNKFNGMASRWFFSAHVVQWSVELWSEVRCKKCSPAHWSPMILIIWTCCHKTCILNRLDFNRVRNKICMHIVERKNNITLNRSNERFDWLCSMTIKTWKSTHANKKKHVWTSRSRSVTNFWDATPRKCVSIVITSNFEGPPGPAGLLF